MIPNLQKPSVSSREEMLPAIAASYRSILKQVQRKSIPAHLSKTTLLFVVDRGGPNQRGTFGYTYESSQGNNLFHQGLSGNSATGGKGKDSQFLPRIDNNDDG